MTPLLRHALRRALRSVPPLLLLLGGRLPTAGAQTIHEITEAALGFPVPRAVESLTPVAGFRSYASLRMRFDDLWLRCDHIERLETGESVHGRVIHSYRFTSPGDHTPEGVLKSGALIDGTLHAREWQSPEVTAAVFERLALAGEDPAVRYLLDHMVVVLHPLANPDGLVQSQTYPDRTVGGGSTGGGNDGTGRDGRMRRKNLRSADQDLSTLGDHLLGVNLNGNFDIAFGKGRPGSHLDPTDLSYVGPGPASEPETLALIAAADAARVLGENRLRYYMDFHSYGQEHFVVLVDEAARNAVAERVYAVMRDTTRAISGARYERLCAHVDGRFGCDAAGGVSDVYFAEALGCVAYTCEIRPPVDRPGANGFILADAAIDEARRELVPATMAALLYMCGPPALIEVSIYAAPELALETPAPVYRERRSFDEETGAREIEVLADGAIRPDATYSAVLRFNKPMRVLSQVTGKPEPFPGSRARPVVVELGAHQGVRPRWAFAREGEPDGYDRYPGDTLIVDLAVTGPADCGERQTLSVDATDLVGHRLDANPLTVVDWSPAGWTGYEDQRGRPTLQGGPDTWAQVRVEPRSCDAVRFVRADCNDDGSVDIADALCALGWLFADGPAPACAAATDANGDAGVNISDVAFLLQHLFSGGPAPASPFPECGPGSAADAELGCETPPRRC